MSIQIILYLHWALTSKNVVYLMSMGDRTVKRKDILGPSRAEGAGLDS